MRSYFLILLAFTAQFLSSEARAEGDEFFDSGGVKIRYVTAGTGTPVVLIHGWMADSTMWGRDDYGNTKLDVSKSPEFRAIAFDCRGHGKSDKPTDPNQYGTEMAADVVRLLDHLKIGKAHLIGYSSGAYIVGNVAATHPDRVLSVIFAGQGPVLSETYKPSDFSECDLFSKAVDEGKGLGPYLRAVTPETLPRPTPEQADALAKYLYGGKDVKAFALAGQGFRKLAVSVDQLGKCKAPILFIHGELESEHVKSKAATARKLLGRGELKIIDDGDHMTTLANPEFGAAIVEFLRSVNAGPATQSAPATQREPSR